LLLPSEDAQYPPPPIPISSIDPTIRDPNQIPSVIYDPIAHNIRQQQQLITSQSQLTHSTVTPHGSIFNTSAGSQPAKMLPIISSKFDWALGVLIDSISHIEAILVDCARSSSPLFIHPTGRESVALDDDLKRSRPLDGSPSANTRLFIPNSVIKMLLQSFDAVSADLIEHLTTDPNALPKVSQVIGILSKPHQLQTNLEPLHVTIASYLVLHPDYNLRISFLTLIGKLIQTKPGLALLSP
jgi:hypothetical protein